ncbi:hypothetical protein JHK82_050189 [Glycine max]|nr:hypothetical protein JHK82_050189 [Glycine max]
MRLLQELAPGCDKKTGKAIMLDEIINYVQSLQQQVESHNGHEPIGGYGASINMPNPSTQFPPMPQHKALEACQKFLVGDAGSDGDEDDKDDEDEDEFVDDYDSKECEEYKFFEKVFAEDGDLRRYYESNQKEGDFHCLVCGGIGKKVWKRFKNCKSLIHHSTAILRTKGKRAHRAYAQVICKVVGWDIDQLPAIVLKDLDSSLTGSRKLLESQESLVSGAEWESESPKAGFSSTASGWPSFDDIKSSSLTYSLSAEEKAIVAMLQLQHRALEACQKFLVGDAGSDSDEDDEEAEDDELLHNDSKESEEYKFFEKVFAEDGDLRRYYENNHKEGDFYCLVCGGIGNKVWKRFKDCIGLIQHSTAILRTRRKQAHRAYAQVICKVIGWDIDQMPAIVLKDLDSSLAGSRKLFVEPKNPVVGCTDDTNSNHLTFDGQVLGLLGGNQLKSAINSEKAVKMNSADVAELLDLIDTGDLNDSSWNW